FVGSKGIIYANDAYCTSPRLIPEASMKAFDRPEKTVKRSVTPGKPQAEWIHCIKNGETPGANFEYAVPLTEMVLTGNLAIRARRKIEWDGANMKVTNVPEANQYLKRTYRKGWEPTPV
ncbi:MAG: gfo/Idh/MocA family oxidoreductase, partial [Verrucomicrobiota bacterium]